MPLCISSEIETETSDYLMKSLVNFNSSSSCAVRFPAKQAAGFKKGVRLCNSKCTNSYSCDNNILQRILTWTGNFIFQEFVDRIFINKFGWLNIF